MDEEKVRKLTDVLVECVITYHLYADRFKDMSVNEVGDRVSKQLKDCGFPNGPVGSLHVYLDQSNFTG